MSDQIQFETPENIQVSYQPAGVGTRFVAWFIDVVLMTVVGFFLFFLSMCTGVIAESVVRDWLEPMREIAEEMENDPHAAEELSAYFLGIWFVVWGLGSFVYFGLSELFLRGQTIGKRMLSIRVAKADGFALQAGSIFVRNIFRVLDQLPPLWIVPVLSKRSQRFGDMVASTVVISDKPEELGDLRSSLAGKPAADCKFRFDNAMLGRARVSDFTAVEQILERWHELHPSQRVALLDQVVPPLVARLQTQPPEIQDRHQFLLDLMAAEYRRQDRKLS